ncbi:Abscission/NoCut checkpoint regulator [Mactra antiquata]
MSCYGCGSQYSAFKKEHGCKQCGFSFCIKCLPNKIAIPKMNNEKHKVCLKCYNIMTGKIKPKEDNPAKYSPPENYKKRMAALQERESHGHKTGPSGSQAQSNLGLKRKTYPKGMSKADIEIEERLNNLRQKTPQEAAASKVSEKDISNRLSALKGEKPVNTTSNKPMYVAPDRRTQQEQMNDLLDEIADEVELDSRLPDPTQDIAARLEKLRNHDKPNNTATGDENNLNKPSLRDSQTFSQNISTSESPSKTNTTQNTSDIKDPDSLSPEEVSRILNEAASELDADAKKALKDLEEDKEIMKRLQEIKQRRKESATDVNKESDDSESENDDDDKLSQHIINQALEENKLDEAAAKDGVKLDNINKTSNKKIINTEEEWYDPDELPYCIICTEDATIRCMGCDRDLYCNNCFSEGHQELGLTDHVKIPYMPPKQSD